MISYILKNKYRSIIFISFKLNFREFIASFKPEEWIYNSPLLLTRILERRVCNTSVAEMTTEKCNGFKVFPSEEFYAVVGDKWQNFFNVLFTGSVLEATKNSTVVHLWNSKTHNTIITKSQLLKSAYEVIAEKNCPKAIKASGKYF